MEIEPVTREEMYLAKAAGQNVETPEPITRKEMFLDAVARNGGSGGGSGLPSGSSPNQYLVTDGEGNAKWEDKLCWSEKYTKEVLPEQKIVFSLSNNGGYSAMISDSSYWAIGDNEDLKVVFDGVEYYCTSATYQVNDNITMYLFGNLGRMGIGDDNGMPFVGGAARQNGTPSSGSVTAFTSEESHTFGVYRVSETIHPIDKKYLPGGCSHLRVVITMDENENYLSSKTYEEIKNHVLNGGTCDCVFGNYLFHLNKASFLSDVQTFVMAYQVVFANVEPDALSYVMIEDNGRVNLTNYTLSLQEN